MTDTTAIVMDVDTVSTLAEAYVDKQDWERISYNGVALIVPNDLVGKVQSVDLNAAKRRELLAYAGTKRWQTETGGIVINGIPIATDDRSKLMLTGARVKAEGDNTFTTKWVGADGQGYPLNAAQIIAISDAVLDHVDACFETFDTVATAITGGAMITRAEVDAAFADI